MNQVRIQVENLEENIHLNVFARQDENGRDILMVIGEVIGELKRNLEINMQLFDVSGKVISKNYAVLIDASKFEGIEPFRASLRFRDIKKEDYIYISTKTE